MYSFNKYFETFKIMAISYPSTFKIMAISYPSTFKIMAISYPSTFKIMAISYPSIMISLRVIVYNAWKHIQHNNRGRPSAVLPLLNFQIKYNFSPNKR